MKWTDQLFHSSLVAGFYDVLTRQVFWRDAIAGMLEYVEHVPQHARVLDLGCGPGRDLLAFRELGHQPVGLDGCAAFVEMATSRTGCTVWHQDFLELELPPHVFDGVFANASLFHVPTQELGRVLLDLYTCLKPGGVLFCSNPRGPDTERFNGDRYGAFLEPATWTDFVVATGFSELEQYYRPKGRPREEQPWFATVWRRPPA